METKEFLVLIFCFFIAFNVEGVPQFSRGGRIAGGSPALNDQFPFQCAIYISTNTEKGLNFCSGSIISETFVLSAAHCFESMTSGFLIAGVKNLQEEIPFYDSDFRPDDVINHKNYNKKNFSNDIALIDVSENPFDFSLSQINKIELGSLTLENLVGKSARVAGWGRTTDGSLEISNVLKYIDAEIKGLDYCSSIYGSKVTTNNLCLSGREGLSTCGGDSGGGLSIENENEEVRVLIGIVSFGAESGCELGYPTVMTFITPHLEWIYNNTKINSEK